MQRVTGIGGVFFRARNPAQLSAWYEEMLGVKRVAEDYGGTAWQQEAGPTVFAPFPSDTDYFGKPEQAWMINFRVADLDALVRELRTRGVKVSDAESYPPGRFVRLNDPEGNPIELWEPQSAPAT